jgi:hypothetical protein
VKRSFSATHDKASGILLPIDIGDAENIHPEGLLDVGKRPA